MKIISKWIHVKDKTLKRLKSFRRKIWVTQSDLFELSINLTQSIYNEASKRSCIEEWMGKTRIKLRIMKTVQTKQKTAIESIRQELSDINQNIHDIHNTIKALKIWAGGMEKCIGDQSGLQNQLNINNVKIFAKIQVIEKKFENIEVNLIRKEEIITLRNAYERANNIEESMKKLEEFENRLCKRAENISLHINSEAERITSISSKYENAIQLQARGITASLHGILRSKGLEI